MGSLSLITVAIMVYLVYKTTDHYLKQQYRFKCEVQQEKKKIFLIDDVSKHFWFKKYFERDLCKYEINFSSEPEQMQKLADNAYFNQGTKVTYCQNNNQICQWIVDIDLAFDKFNMVRFLRNYDNIQQQTQLKSTYFIPETYLLNFDALDDQTFTEDEQKFKELHDTKSIWYAKKSGFQYGRGEDLEIINETDVYYQGTFLRQRQLQLDQFNNPIRDKRIVQKAVKPLLINEKKAEFRNYLLILSLDPFVVLYRDGFLSLGLDKYEHKLTGNTQKDRQNHISTMYVQSQKPNFDENQIMFDNSKVSMFHEQFLQNELQKGEENIQNVKKLEKDIRDMYAYTALALKSELKQPNRGYPFTQYHLLGCDMMVNDEYRPQLLECNAMPSTQGADIYPSRINSRDSVWESLDLVLKLQENVQGDHQKWVQELKNLKQNYNLGKYEILINEADGFNRLN